jgi:hypothetical protein
MKVMDKAMTSEGQLLEAATNPWWLSGCYLGFITAVLKKLKTQFWYTAMVLHFIKTNNQP